VQDGAVAEDGQQPEATAPDDSEQLVPVEEGEQPEATAPDDSEQLEPAAAEPSGQGRPSGED